MKFFLAQNQSISYSETVWKTNGIRIRNSIPKYGNAHGKFHMDRVKSLSISDKTASTSPLCNRSGARSSVHRVIRAKPCCGPKLHGPNCAGVAKPKSINLWLHLTRLCVGELTKYERNTTTNRLFTIEHGQFTVDENKWEKEKIWYKFFFEVEWTLNCFSLNDTWLEKHHVFSTPFSLRWRETQQPTHTRIIIKQRLVFSRAK